MRALIVFCLCLVASAAQAQNCPDFYRFVDFGLQGNDGALYRGGTTLRAESFDGEPMLLAGTSICLPIADVAKDGHGNPIPVVRQIFYDPVAINAGLEELSVFSVDDMQAATAQNAATHKQNLANTDAQITRGNDYLCVSPAAQPGFTCQIVSPFAVNLDLVIGCDAQRCVMPVMAATEKLAVSARWAIDPASAADPAATASDMISKVRQIHDFLKPLSAEF